MARRVSTKAKSKGYIREWMELAGLKQVDLVKRLDYSKSKANAIWHAEQRLNEDVLEEIAALVNADMWELLMSPGDAMRIRRLRAALEGAVAPVAAPQTAPAPASQAKRKAS